MSSLQKKVMKSRLPPMMPRNPRAAARRTRDYSPIEWRMYFQTKRDIKISDKEIFRVYCSGDDSEESPIICLLHGGGFSGLTWSVFTAHVTKMISCRVVALDLRGHGGTLTSDNDLSAETMARDVGRVLEALFPNNSRSVLLVGHSMGGAIAVHVAHMGLIPNLAGVVVIDVVEGTAMESLTTMQSFLRGRPSHFRSLENAIEWCIRSGQIRNPESAKVSMPGQLKNIETGCEALDDVGKKTSPPREKPASSMVISGNSIQEEDEDEAVGTASNDQPFRAPGPFGCVPASQIGPHGKFTWRIDLCQTEKFWAGWFSGLSAKFLDIEVPKLLLLAGVDRLDRELMVGQMQGKFQLQVLPACGHTVHEDLPDKVAESVATFLVRHKLAKATGEFERTFPAC